jgi:hypothetical protein
LEWDPIGAPGNLFYKGFFDLLLGLHAYVSGSQKWRRPFAVVGEPERSFTYTHQGINQLLTEQWASRPEGCHCENTKIWPLCLSAAGLGLKLHDQLYGTDSHWAFDQWWEMADGKYLEFAGDGTPTGVALYHDPLVDHTQPGGPIAAVATAFYLAPQRPDVASRLFAWAADVLRWRDGGPTSSDPPTGPRFLAMATALARELDDEDVYTQLRGFAEREFEPTWNDRGEFHYGFGLGERIPRGQPNATLLVADAGGPGSWQRIFSGLDEEKFDDPTVSGVDYPRLGICQAHYDREGEELAIATYAANPDLAGQRTSFFVDRLLDANAWQVSCDGRPFDRIEVIGPDRLQLTAEISEHTYVISRATA